MPSASIQFTGSIAGISFSGDASRTETGQQSHEVTIPAGNLGTLSGMDSAGTAGTVGGLDSGHSIASGDTVAIWKSAAQADGTQVARYNVPVSADTATSFDFTDDSAAGGDTLPADDTAVVAGEFAEVIDADFDGDDALSFVLVSTVRTAVQFQTAAGVEIATFVLQANEPYIWLKDNGVTNPLAGQVVGKIAAAGGATSAGTLKVGVLYDSGD